ncbi:MAG TPA: aminodeoxychorismate synthase component I [Solirubrobacteraceae bacterium]|nr:aminodeoxychorismate synthase component I [Solirubrobacteraceae bacterium]
MKTLLIDNYDSFTYNLFQLLAEANGDEPIVVRNDDADWSQLRRLEFDNVVISAGPGSPEHDGDFGVCAQAIEQADVPLLGVCLGHQGLSWVHGAAVRPAPIAMHGRISTVLHDGSALFAGIPREFQAVRYHSLCVAQPLPAVLQAIASSSDGVLMAVAHRTRPQWGVQFHPESICTEHGRQLLANFRDLTSERAGARSRATRATPANGGPPPTPTRPTAQIAGAQRPRDAARTELALKVKRLEGLYEPERVFVDLYADSETAFWLDSSQVGERARFSFIGSADGPLGAVITYGVGNRQLRIECADGVEVREESIFDYLSREMRRTRRISHELPFDFDCGFVGYFGYELKADCEGDDAHRSTMPDAAFVFADRLIAFDHLKKRTYLLCLTRPGGEEEADGWIAETSLRLGSSAAAPGVAEGEWAEQQGPVELRLSRSHQQYLQDIATCKRRLIEGETYEICLTNTITAEGVSDPLALYRTLRRVNPAPFSAYLRFGERAVLSSSPERFLAIGRDCWVEAKPIKGTCPRGATPAEDARLAEQLRLGEKTRAENLMIVDVLRNDLGVVCEVGSVHVPTLMHVESYETVHQLVSTVRGRLRENVEPPDCIRACFPGGSMTGAPKKRTMEIIDELEGEARGVYSGAIGYLGLSGGCDLSIVIRTIVVDRETATLGVGGAIVMQSDAEEEYQETLLKARAPIAAIDPSVDPHEVFERTCRRPSAAGLRPEWSNCTCDPP